MPQDARHTARSQSTWRSYSLDFARHCSVDPFTSAHTRSFFFFFLCEIENLGSLSTTMVIAYKEETTFWFDALLIGRNSGYGVVDGCDCKF